MPYILNSRDEVVRTQAHGNWWTWKPQEIKYIEKRTLADFLSQHRGEDGLVEVPESVMMTGERDTETYAPADRSTQEFKDAIFAVRQEGIRKYLAKQNWIVRNLEISLRGDYEKSGRKGNFLFEASQGELQAYKNLKHYKQYEQEQALNVADEIQKIRNDLYGGDESRPNPMDPDKK